MSLYDRIAGVATIRQIQAILRRHKETAPDEIHITGIKSDLISNLEHAVKIRVVPLEEVTALLRESEENGHQHVLYYVAKSRAAAGRAGDGQQIAQGLWGENWQSIESFPKFDHVPKSYEWADFRLGYLKKPKDWIAKLYGLELNRHLESEEDLPDGRFARYYRDKQERSVLLIRWNAPDLLEIRISRCDSAKQLATRITAVWDRIRPAVIRDDFIEWNLSMARGRLARTREENEASYYTNAYRLTDPSSGVAIFRSHTDEESTDEEPVRQQAIDSYLRNNDCECPVLGVMWHVPERRGAAAHDLHTIISPRHPHELVIPARTSSETVEYVTNQLRQFNA